MGRYATAAAPRAPPVPAQESCPAAGCGELPGALMVGILLRS